MYVHFGRVEVLMPVSSQKIKNNAETLLNAYFLKVKLMDAGVQRKVTNIFLPAITAVIRDVPQEHRTNVFKHLLAIVGMCILVYQQGDQVFGKKIKDKKFLDGLCVKYFGTVSKLIVELLKNKVGHGKKIVDRILHAVFVDDLACDMGAKLSEYRKASPADKEKLKLDIELLLADYNEINNKDLTFDDVLNRGVKDEDRRSN